MIRRILLIKFYLLLSLTFAFSQSVNTRQLSRLNVSESLQERLAERLNLFIKYEISQQYDKQFDLIVTKCQKNSDCENLTKEEYIKRKLASEKSYGKVLSMDFISIDRKLKDNSVSISLLPKLQLNNKITYDSPATVAFLQEGDWFFRFAYQDY